jgi:hypothetical protein
MWPLSSNVRRLLLGLSAASPVSAIRHSLAARHPARPRPVAPRRKSDWPSSSRCQALAGAGTTKLKSALPAVPRSGTFRLTIRSSGQSNRFAIGAAA